MNAFGLLTILMLIFFSGTATDVAAENDTDYRDLFIDKPFSTKNSLKSVLTQYPDTTIDELNSLKRLLLYKYKFDYDIACPFPKDQCDLYVTKYSSITRTIEIDITDLITEIQKYIFSLREDGCSFFHINSTAGVTKNSIVVNGSFKGKRRWCYWFFGDKVQDIGGISGNYTLNLSILSVAPKIKAYKKRETKQLGSYDIQSTDEKHVTSQHFLGFINIDTFLGKPFKFLLNENISPVKWVNDLLGHKSPKDYIKKYADDIENHIALVQKSVNEATLSKKYIKKASINFWSYDYYLAPKETIFDKKNGKYIITQTERGYIFNNCIVTKGNTCDELLAKEMLDLEHKNKVCEIKELSSRKNGAKNYTIQKNDTLWKISEREYCDGEQYLYILHNNKKLIDDYNMIKPGQTISLEPLWKFSMMISNGYVIRPGDTVWDILKKENKIKNWNKVTKTLPAGSSNIDNIYPLQIFDHD